MKVVDNYNFPEEIFGCKVNDTLIWETIRTYLYNRRQGKASTKSRTEVAGGGRKPWRQKGTGRSRQGTIRSPIWRGGGVVFGPKPREFFLQLPKKKKRKALLQSLSQMFQSERIRVIDEFVIPEPKTKLLYEFIKSIEVENKKVLIVLDKKDRNIDLAARNIPNLAIELVGNLNALTVLKHEYLLFTKSAIDAGCQMWKGKKRED